MFFLMAWHMIVFLSKYSFADDKIRCEVSAFIRLMKTSKNWIRLLRSNNELVEYI